MSGFIESANAVSWDVLARLWTVLWQWTLIAVVAAAVILWLRRAQPAVRFWLWNLLLLKLLLMPFWVLAVETDALAEEAITAIRPAERTPSAASTKNGATAGADKSLPPVGPLTAENEVSTQTRGETDTESSVVLLAGTSWTTCLIVAWFLLIAGKLARTLWQRVRLRQFLSIVGSADGELQSRVADIAVEIGMRKSPRVAVSPDDCSPFVCGLWQPVLVLPASLPGTLSDASFRQVVLHELAHLKRRDLLWCWLPELVRVAFWFHPLVHWICRRIHLERELACDQVAMFHSDGNAGSYAQTLVDVVTHAGDAQNIANGSSGAAQLLTVRP